MNATAFLPPLSDEAILRLASQPVPRYTSYPTAPHFHAGITSATYAGWLKALPEKAALSLYVHVPFCDTLCWFCGCHTKITRKYEPVAAYLEALKREISAVAARVPASSRVTHIHWGGGSPTILEPDDIRELGAHLKACFKAAPQMEFAIEVDPRGLDGARIRAMAEAGLTRVSLGVQDFDPEVQKRINRIQTFDETRDVITAFRMAGVRSLNIDAIYGLPGQGEAELMASLAKVVSLRPDRIALFGYAHVPWMKAHMKMIDTDLLPDIRARHAHATAAARFLVLNGYEQVGIDHFALPEDDLAAACRDNTLHRNFQGYTTDDADALIGFGASAIGRLPQGHVQNLPAIAQYERAVADGGLAIGKGLALSEDDRLRSQVIETLMCTLAFPADQFRKRFGKDAEPILRIAQSIMRDDQDGLVVPTDTGFVVTERGRPFLRTIAARFDAYLGQSAARHSAPV